MKHWLLAALLLLAAGQAPAALVHRYSFASDASDSVGGAHGQLVNGALVSGGALVLNGANQYVNLPNGLLAGINNITVEVWITDNGSASWARIFDFGSSTGGEDFPIGSATASTRGMFLTPRSGAGTLRGSHTLSGGGAGEQVVDTAPLPTGAQRHVVWAYDAATQTAALYVNGVLAAYNRAVTIKPSDMEPTVNNWIGRSQFNDPFLIASINEFRMYDHRLSAAQIAANFAAGPDSTNGTPGVLQSVVVQGAATLPIGGAQQLTVIGNYSGLANISLALDPAVSFVSSDPGVLAVSAAGQVRALEFGVATITVSYQGLTNAITITVTQPPQTLTHRYSFTTDARDSVGGANGTLLNGATIVNGAVTLNGASQYVDLPNNLVTGYTSVTFEAWATDNGSGGWARLWDIGNSSAGEGAAGTGTSYMFLAWPYGGGGGIRSAYKLSSTGEQLVNATPQPATGVRHHIVWTQDGAAQTARLYVDGVQMGVNTAFTYTPAAVGDTLNDWLGRSQFSADPYFNGSIDEFRVYNVALTAAEVQQNFALGPDVSAQSGPATITAQPQSLTVLEQQPARFQVEYSGQRPVIFQWFRDGQPIAGATNAAFRLASVLPADSGAVFTVAITNTAAGVTYSVMSAEAVLTVQPDVAAPVALRAFNVGTGLVHVVFSEAVAEAEATNLANYAVSAGVTLTGASLAADGRTVALEAGPLVFGSNYTVTLSGIHDRATTPNLINSNSTVVFTASPYAPAEVGGASPAGYALYDGAGYVVAGAGGDIGGTSDQFGFNYRQVNGDFDVQVRVASLTGSDLWAKAGLMARESLDPASPFAAALATPGLVGSYFAARGSAGLKATVSGSVPVNYPQTWLRLRRAGDVFTGFASYDGREWTQLGTVTLAVSSNLYLGMALSSHTNGGMATAQFLELGDTASLAAAPVVPPRFEPLGPSTRRTGLVFSEIMYRPAPRADGRVLEFVEIYNSNPFFHDLSGYRLSGDVDFQFPAGTILAGGGFLVVAANPADLQAVYGLSGVYGPYTNTLKTAGLLRLRDEQDAILLEVEYANSHPWPMAADGTGHSIVLARPSYGENDPRAWAISEVVGGSPGRAETYRPSPLRDVVINEVLANADPAEDFVELYNHSRQSNDLSGCILTDNPATNKFVLPPNTWIAPGGFLVFSQTQLGFGLKAGGDTIYLKNPDATRVLDAVRFEAQARGVSLGRWPDGANDFYPLAEQSPGASNGTVRVSDIVINELMYHPISGHDDDQYVELYNQGTNTIDLAGWRLTAGISFVFPTNTLLPAGGYLVVARNQTNLLAKYSGLNAGNTVGDFTGRLSHGGERVALARPELNISVNGQGRLETNVLNVVVDEVTYGDGGRWGQWADGGGSSLELIDPAANHRLAANWADSDETAKAPWTTIEIVNGRLDHGSNYNNEVISNIQVGQLDAGECLVDNFEVFPQGGTLNLVANPGFENGLANWAAHGCFSRSNLEPGAGEGGGNALRLRTDNRFFTLANYAQGTLSGSTLAAGSTATLRFKARWLRGCREVLMRLNGNWLEAVGAMQVPANLGTPGAPNSRAANAPPAISEVTHLPALPAANQPVVVVARVHDPDGVPEFQLHYRLDANTNYIALPMKDDGTDGDAVAGDGVFSATIPGGAAGSAVAFVLTTADGRGAGSRFPALLDNNAPARECVVRWGEPEPAQSFGTYHLWLTSSNVTRWQRLPVLSNEDIDGTLVYNGRVIYNMAARYAGSPYHQAFDGPAGGRACHYNWQMPKDDKLLGHTSFNKMHWIGNDIQNDIATANNDDATLQREQVANELLRGLGLPWVYRRYVAVYVNGVRRGQLMEDALRPSVSVPDQYFPGDTGGFLYKIQPWFEGQAPNAGLNATTPWQNKDWASLMPYLTVGGAHKQARYRWTYEPRQAADLLNNYSNVFALINAANAYTTPNYASNLMQVANMENWMRLVAANHAAGNWDCVGVQNNQNVYGYVSPQVKWTYFMFDFSIVLGNPISWGPGANLEVVVPGNASFPADFAWQRIYANPATYPANPGNPIFRRMFWRGLKELATRVMQPERIERLMDARYAAFQASGITAANPQVIKDWVASARASIASQAAAFDTTQFGPVSSTLSFATNSFTFGGKAPLEVTTIAINGVVYPVTWTSMTDWTVRLAAPFGTNTVTLAGYDYFGNPLSNAVREVTVINTQPTDPPEGSVVIHEIMANPAVPDAEYVELFNTSSNTTFDLSAWRFNGLAYTFPGGSLIGPRGYVVLAKDRAAYTAAYGTNAPLFDVFAGGNLQANGETLTLLRPGAVPGEEIIVDQVRYESAAPWPAATNGIALQLADARQDNRRVSNWRVPANGWRYATITGTNLVGTAVPFFYLNGLGEVYIDEVKLVQGLVPEAGTNWVVNGDFEQPLTNGWTLPKSNQLAEIVATNTFAGGGSLRLKATNASVVILNTSLKSILAASLPTGRAFTLSYWYLPVPGNPNFTARLYPGSMTLTHSAAPPPAATPGVANSVATTLPPYPPLWLNEVQPVNTTGLADGAGERDPWVEIFNAGTNAVSLDGWSLAASYTNLGQWYFPTDAVVNPGEFLVVWLDGQPQQTAGREYHADFRPAATNGSIALSRLVNAAPQVVDYLNYAGVPANYTYGAIPDGQPFYRQVMYHATPGGTNDGAVAPVAVSINEWMAGNGAFLANPANGGQFDDWFELYNPGGAPADLSGYYLTDDLGSPFQYRIPTGWVIPPGGYLLVWADNRTALNTNHTDLHVNFRLNLGGEAIGLFSPDGTAIDTVTFGPQTNDVSEGRFPDGATNRYFMAFPTPRAANRLSAPTQPPQLVGAAVGTGNGTFTFGFLTTVGQTYRVEYKDSLQTNVAWSAAETYPGTGQPVSASFSLTNSPQRFYRVVILP